MSVPGRSLATFASTGAVALVAMVLQASNGQSPADRSAMAVALEPSVAFLSKEVPRWRAEEGCYSCHNNGDAARALIAAGRAGFVTAEPLANTIAFLSKPGDWSGNSRGGPFDDQPLARVQFGGALADAVAAGLSTPASLVEAARLIAADQHPDGAWRFDPSNSLGSPATYGTALATWAARRVLVAAAEDDLAPHVARADAWFRTATVDVTPDAAAVLLALGDADDDAAAAQRAKALEFLLTTQGPDGGWGPNARVRAEVFDTAIALLALGRQASSEPQAAALTRGRAFLLKIRLEDGSWPETTRPPGQRSYAQLISTTGWAVLALLQ